MGDDTSVFSGLKMEGKASGFSLYPVKPANRRRPVRLRQHRWTAFGAYGEDMGIKCGGVMGCIWHSHQCEAGANWTRICMNKTQLNGLLK